MVLLLLACNAPKEEGYPTCDITPPDAGTLVVDGPLIRDSLGRQVTLRGVNAGGRSKFAPYMPFDFDDFYSALADYLNRAADWGINVLRVPFSWAALEPEQGVIDEEWAGRYDALLDGAWERGMYTFVDAHQDIYSEAYCGDGFPLWTLVDPPEPRHDCAGWFFAYVTGDPDIQAAFDDFWADERGTRTAFGQMWKGMAQRHRDRPGVIGYEILNEPYEGSADHEVWAQTTLPEFYTEIAAILNAEDPDAMVFFDSTGTDATDATTALLAPQGDRLVFAPHFYDPAVFSGASTFTSDVDASLGRWRDKGTEWNMPVLLGEYGADPDVGATEDYALAMQEAMDKLQLHGTWWEYSVAEESWNFEDFSIVEADGTQNAVLSDAVARPFPAAIAGTDATWAFDGATFRLDWQADGITELRWPTRLGSPQLRGEGGCASIDGTHIHIDAKGPSWVEVQVPPMVPVSEP